jgi:hypothetical protein
MAKVRPARIYTLSYCLEGNELIIQNAKLANKLVQCGRAGCVARALMLCGVTESNERTLGKLLSKLHQADLPETQSFADVPAGHNFKKRQIMHIVNNISKGTTPGLDGNRTEFYMNCVVASSTIAVDAFQRAYTHFVNMLA